MDLERKDNEDADEDQTDREVGEWQAFSFTDPTEDGESGEKFPIRTANSDVLVPAGVLQGIRELSNGETADADDLDDALMF